MTFKRAALFTAGTAAVSAPVAPWPRSILPSEAGAFQPLFCLLGVSGGPRHSTPWPAVSQPLTGASPVAAKRRFTSDQFTRSHQAAM